MDITKQEETESVDNKANINETKEARSNVVKLSTFLCSMCNLEEKYDYFGMNPPYMKHYILLEDSYTIEDPFVPPKQGEFIILGTNCVKCKKTVCKDQECSIYFDNTTCLKCAKACIATFPNTVQDKINKLTSK